jgi:predicted ester cyclase
MMPTMPTKTQTRRTSSAATTKSTAEVARSYFEAVGRGDVDAMESHYEPGSVGKIHGLVELHVGGNYREWFGNLFRAFPDWNYEILDIVAEGEKAAVRWRARGTFNGDAKFEGMEPNGASVDVEGCDLVTIRDGKLVDNHAYTSGTEMARQLGALPPQGSIAERGMTGALNLKTRATALLQRRSG